MLAYGLGKKAKSCPSYCKKISIIAFRYINQIQFTESATNKITELFAKQNGNESLILDIKNAGCMGNKIAMRFGTISNNNANLINLTDTTTALSKKYELKTFLDQGKQIYSSPQLHDTVGGELIVNYQQDEFGVTSTFTFDHDKIREGGGCGCGSSFA